MSNYVERDLLAYRIKYYMDHTPEDSKEHYAYSVALKEIQNAPITDAAPIVHAWWNSFLDGDYIMPKRYYRCSRCGRVESRRQPYCNCGAKMNGGDSDV